MFIPEMPYFHSMNDLVWLKDVLDLSMKPQKNLLPPKLPFNHYEFKYFP